jgi:hypothetical protein
MATITFNSEIRLRSEVGILRAKSKHAAGLHVQWDYYSSDAAAAGLGGNDSGLGSDCRFDVAGCGVDDSCEVFVIENTNDADSGNALMDGVSGFQRGQRVDYRGPKVEARYRGTFRYFPGRHYPGKIYGVNRNGTYDIEFEGGQVEEQVAEDNICISETRSPIKFGDIIALRASAATDKKDSDRKYLGTNVHSGTLVMQRGIITRSEKWEILPASAAETEENYQAIRNADRPLVFSCDKICLRNMDGAYLVFGVEDASITLVSNLNKKLKLTDLGYDLGDIGVSVSREVPINQNASWQIMHSAVPYMPDWVRDNPFSATKTFADEDKARSGKLESLILSGGVGSSGGGAHSRSSLGLSSSTPNEMSKPLSEYPLQFQEQLLVQEIISAMLGVEGRYIKAIEQRDIPIRVPLSAPYRSYKFCIESSLVDVSLAELAGRVLQLCNDYVKVTQFVDSQQRYEYGLTAHAFGAAVKLLLKEYLVLVAQLESHFLQGQLTLQKLWFYTQPSLRTMETLSTMCGRAARECGGVLLNSIFHTQTHGGADERASVVHSFIMQKASAPFFEMLSDWLYGGKIDDPYGEFLIKEQKDAAKDEMGHDFNAKYWESGYVFRRALVPTFIEKSCVHVLGQRWEDKLRDTGKYLSVVRKCGLSIQCPFARRLSYLGSDEQHRYGEIVHEAHEYASQLLLKLIMGENKLMERLRSIKHYFLLDQGDFFVHFMDVADKELSQQASTLTKSRLDALLQMSLQISSAAGDTCKEDLSCKLSERKLIDELRGIHEGKKSSKFSIGLTGLEAFTLDYSVKWPLTLILSRQAMTKYQLIFRHLLLSKHVERQLCETWLHQQGWKELKLKGFLGMSYRLRQKMLHFMQNFVYYMLFEVLEPHWHTFEEKVGDCCRCRSNSTAIIAPLQNCHYFHRCHRHRRRHHHCHGVVSIVPSPLPPPLLHVLPACLVAFLPFLATLSSSLPSFLP